jgi:hypothetical protein
MRWLCPPNRFSEAPPLTIRTLVSLNFISETLHKLTWSSYTTNQTLTNLKSKAILHLCGTEITSKQDIYNLTISCSTNTWNQCALNKSTCTSSVDYFLSPETSATSLTSPTPWAEQRRQEKLHRDGIWCSPKCSGSSQWSRRCGSSAIGVNVEVQLRLPRRRPWWVRSRKKGNKSQLSLATR